MPELQPLRYSDACPSLPATRGKGYPHYVNTSTFSEETDISNLTFADGIATFLWNWDRTRFTRFFDMTKPNFEISRDAPDGMISCMIISSGMLQNCTSTVDL